MNKMISHLRWLFSIHSKLENMRISKCILMTYFLSVFPANAGDTEADISKALDATDKGRCSKAFSILESARNKTPNDYQVYMETGAIYIRCNEQKESKQFYAKAIALAKHETVQNQYTKSDIAVAYRAIGDYANAIIYGKEAKKMFVKAGDTNQVERMDILISDLQSK